MLRDQALEFEPEEGGILSCKIGDPYVIPPFLHGPWEIKPIKVPAMIRDSFTKLVEGRLLKWL